MPKKLGGTDDFNPKKQNRINDFKEGRRFSFRVPGNVPQPDTECGKLEIPDFKRQKNDVGRASGDAVLYSGEQLENYKKQYPRFERAIDLVPDGKITRDGNQVYFFCSKNSPTGYWEVTLNKTTPTYFIDAGEPLTIICPIPFRITQVQSNGISFRWTQLEGGRLAVVDPDNTIDPTLLILDNIRDSRPIRFEIAVEQDLSVKDTLIIYTTPTSNFDGLSYEIGVAVADGEPPRAIPFLTRPAAPLPQYLQRAYFTPAGTYTFTWDLPTAYPQYLVETVWQQNTTGQYLDVQRFPVSSSRLFVAELNTHYRVLSVYDVLGNTSVKDSQRFYFTSGNRLVIGDDNFDGLSFASSSRRTVFPLDRKVLQLDDNFDGLSYQNVGKKVTLPLDGQSVKLAPDSFNGISFASVSRVTKNNLGGVILS